MRLNQGEPLEAELRQRPAEVHGVPAAHVAHLQRQARCGGGQQLRVRHARLRQGGGEDPKGISREIASI